MRRRLSTRAVTAILVVMGTSPWIGGCARSSWNAAKRTDTVAAYNQFIRDHPGSRYAEKARERMALLRVKTYQTVESFEDFEREYPQSELLPELRVAVEPLFFERARRINTPDAYREFLDLYPQGEYAVRAFGNLTYVEQVLPSPTRALLEEFIETHPESDFVPEAKTTLEIAGTLRDTTFHRLGVRVDVSPNVAQADRVARGFASMIAQAYRARGIQVVPLAVDRAPGPELDGWVRVDYREAPAASALGTSALYSYCRIRLYHRDLEEPVWDRSFEAPADHLEQSAYGRDKTLFANARYRFWEDFFVPVATWAVSNTRIKELQYLEEVRAIDVLGDAGVVLLERGGIDFLDVSSPAELHVEERYRRELDLADWRGVRLLDRDLALTFGNDGAELIRRGDQSATQVARWDAGALGAVRGAALFDPNTLLIGGSRGVHAVRLNREPLVPQRLLDGDVVGLEIWGAFIYVIRPDRIEVGWPRHLLMHLTANRIPLPPGFRAERARRIGDSLYVFGKNAVAQVSVADPGRPKLVSVVEHEDVGEIADMVATPGQRYILGERGLQIANAQSGDVWDYIQVGASRGLTLKGRFALMVGEKTVEVLDLSPYQEGVPSLTASSPGGSAGPEPAAPAEPADDPAAPDPTATETATEVTGEAVEPEAGAPDGAPGASSDDDATAPDTFAPVPAPVAP